jgi:hypothetical protein
MQPNATPTPQFYTWKGYRCAYEVYPKIDSEASQNLPLLLIHPIGVGLSRRFWYRFCDRWQQQGYQNPIYNPDLPREAGLKPRRLRRIIFVLT